MATPVIVNTVTVSAISINEGGPTTVSANVPNVQSGDWLLASFGAVYVAPTNMTITGSWNEVGSPLGNTGNNQHFLMRTWYQEVSSSGSQTVTVGADHEKMLIVYHLRGCEAVDGVSGVATAQGGGNASQSAPSVSTEGNDNLLLGFWGGIQFDDTTLSYSISTMEDAIQSPALNWTRFMSASQGLTSSGSTGARVATASRNPSNGSASRLVSIRGGGEPVPTGPEPGRFLLAV